MRHVLGLSAALLLGGCPGGGDEPIDTDTDPVDTDPGGDTDDTDVGTGDARVDAVLALQGDAADGEQVYTLNCGPYCHGTTGRGKNEDAGLLGNDLTEEVPGMTRAALVALVLYGKGSMTSFDGFVSDQEIADVVAYVEATFGD